jgi:hypothetical protein
LLNETWENFRHRSAGMGLLIRFAVRGKTRTREERVTNLLQLSKKSFARVKLSFAVPTMTTYYSWTALIVKHKISFVGYRYKILPFMRKKLPTFADPVLASLTVKGVSLLSASFDGFSLS